MNYGPSTHRGHSAERRQPVNPVNASNVARGSHIGSLSKKVHQMLNYLFYKTTILTGVGRETPLSSLRGVDVPPWLHK